MRKSIRKMPWHDLKEIKDGLMIGTVVQPFHQHLVAANTSKMNIAQLNDWTLHIRILLPAVH